MEFGGGSKTRVEGKDDRTNEVSDLRRECLRKTHPVHTSRETAERTEMRVKTPLKGDSSQNTKSSVRPRASRLCPADPL